MSEERKTFVMPKGEAAASFHANLDPSRLSVEREVKDGTISIINRLDAKDSIPVFMSRPTSLAYLHEQNPESLVLLNGEGKSAEVGEDVYINPELMIGIVNNQLVVV